MIRGIIDEIKMSGYPLEIRITNVLKSYGWIVLNQECYVDYETGKLRTIDIIATKRVDISKSSIFDRILIELIIECKHSLERHWVFFIGEKEREFKFPIMIVKNIGKPKKEISYYDVNNILANSHYYKLQSPDNVAIVSHETFKGEKKPSTIFEATNQVLKALIYQYTKSRKMISTNLSPSILIIFYPIIIFDGYMFKCRIEDNEPKIFETDYIQYIVNHRALDNPFSTECYLIEVMKDKFLPKYLQKIDEELRILRKAIEK